MPSPEELMRQHALAALRDERDAALEENKRLRELYENVTANRERFGWTINHLLECQEALRTVEQHEAEVRAEERAATLREQQLSTVAQVCSLIDCVEAEWEGDAGPLARGARLAVQGVRHQIALRFAHFNPEAE